MTMDKPSPALSKGEQFLQDNKKKDGVITLPSGLQYKVLVEGSGLKRPLVDTPCDCHYLGTLIDGTQFDSSFDRGKPSTFAPNQVIKGWTEAMQLMVEGDKWEMYIPSPGKLRIPCPSVLIQYRFPSEILLLDAWYSAYVGIFTH